MLVVSRTIDHDPVVLVVDDRDGRKSILRCLRIEPRNRCTVRRVHEQCRDVSTHRRPYDNTHRRRCRPGC